MQLIAALFFAALASAAPAPSPVVEVVPKVTPAAGDPFGTCSNKSGETATLKGVGPCFGFPDKFVATQCTVRHDTCQVFMRKGCTGDSFTLNAGPDAHDVRKKNKGGRSYHCGLGVGKRDASPVPAPVAAPAPADSPLPVNPDYSGRCRGKGLDNVHESANYISLMKGGPTQCVKFWAPEGVEYCEHVEPAGPGFCNIYPQVNREVSRKDDDY